MTGSGEQIHRSYFFYGIILLVEDCKVAGEGSGVAGHIDDAGRSHLRDRIDQIGRQALTRRIDDHDVRRDPLPFQLCGSLGRVGTDEARVGDTVAVSVLLRVLDRLGNDLDADQVFAVICHGQADRTRTAVQIDERFLSRQPSVFSRDAVQLFRLCAIDLIKGSRRDIEPQPAERIADTILSVNGIALFTEDNIGIIGIDIDDYTFDLFVFF